MSEFLLRVTVLPLLDCPCFKLNIEQDKNMQSFVNQARNWMIYIWFWSFLLIPSIME